jgi:hypothetical protein
MNEREAFEKWWDDGGSEFKDSEENCAWATWQARATLASQDEEIAVLKSDFAVQKLHIDRAFDELMAKDAEIARLHALLVDTAKRLDKVFNSLP